MPLARPAALFRGEHSLRVKGESRALVASLALAPVAIGLAGVFFQGVTFSEVTLLAVLGLVYVSLSRGRLLGSSVRVSERQFPEVHADVVEVAAALGIAQPLIFLRDDTFVPITAIGTEEPYALVISSQYFEHLQPAELKVLVARELSHIAAGHTRIASLLSASGRENAVVSLLFGAWLRRCEYTCDRVGMLFCDRIEDAVSAIAITTFHAIGRRVDYEVLAEQRRELESDARLRLGELSSATPFATHRIAALQEFASSDLARFWKAQIAQPTTALPEEKGTRDATVGRRDCAAPPRRLAAALIDLAVVNAIFQSGIKASVQNATQTMNRDDLKELAKLWPALAAWVQANHLQFSFDYGPPLGYVAYCAFLVAISGQTLGMMVTEIRVVTTRFDNPGVRRTIVRYFEALISIGLVFPAVIGMFFRIQPHDRLSGTRVVRSARL